MEKKIASSENKKLYKKENFNVPHATASNNIYSHNNINAKY